MVLPGQRVLAKNRILVPTRTGTLVIESNRQVEGRLLRGGTVGQEVVRAAQEGRLQVQGTPPAATQAVIEAARTGQIQPTPAPQALPPRSVGFMVDLFKSTAGNITGQGIGMSRGFAQKVGELRAEQQNAAKLYEAAYKAAPGTREARQQAAFQTLSTDQRLLVQRRPKPYTASREESPRYPGQGGLVEQAITQGFADSVVTAKNGQLAYGVASVFENVGIATPTRFPLPSQARADFTASPRRGLLAAIERGVAANEKEAAYRQYRNTASLEGPPSTRPPRPTSVLGKAKYDVTYGLVEPAKQDLRRLRVAAENVKLNLGVTHQGNQVSDAVTRTLQLGSYPLKRVGLPAAILVGGLALTGGRTVKSLSQGQGGAARAELIRGGLVAGGIVAVTGALFKDDFTKLGYYSTHPRQATFAARQLEQQRPGSLVTKGVNFGIDVAATELGIRGLKRIPGPVGATTRTIDNAITRGLNRAADTFEVGVSKLPLQATVRRGPIDLFHDVFGQKIIRGRDGSAIIDVVPSFPGYFKTGESRPGRGRGTKQKGVSTSARRAYQEARKRTPLQETGLRTLVEKPVSLYEETKQRSARIYSAVKGLGRDEARLLAQGKTVVRQSVDLAGRPATLIASRALLRGETIPGIRIRKDGTLQKTKERPPKPKKYHLPRSQYGGRIDDLRGTLRDLGGPESPGGYGAGQPSRVTTTRSGDVVFGLVRQDQVQLVAVANRPPKLIRKKVGEPLVARYIKKRPTRPVSVVSQGLPSVFRGGTPTPITTVMDRPTITLTIAPKAIGTTQTGRSRPRRATSGTKRRNVKAFQDYKHSLRRSKTRTVPSTSVGSRVDPLLQRFAQEQRFTNQLQKGPRFFQGAGTPKWRKKAIQRRIMSALGVGTGSPAERARVVRLFMEASSSARPRAIVVDRLARTLRRLLLSQATSQQERERILRTYTVMNVARQVQQLRGLRSVEVARSQSVAVVTRTTQVQVPTVMTVSAQDLASKTQTALRQRAKTQLQTRTTQELKTRLRQHLRLKTQTRLVQQVRVVPQSLALTALELKTMSAAITTKMPRVPVPRPPRVPTPRTPTTPRPPPPKTPKTPPPDVPFRRPPRDTPPPSLRPPFDVLGLPRGWAAGRPTGRRRVYKGKKTLPTVLEFLSGNVRRQGRAVGGSFSGLEIRRYH
jgi:hypothetical protein